MTTEGKRRVQTVPGHRARVRNAPRRRNRVAVARSDEYRITHYTMALEDDPRYANDPLVTANGIPGRHRSGFLFGGRGIIMQGTGLASDGQYITIDWSHGRPRGTSTWFKYGMGGAHGSPVPWRTIAVDRRIIPLGSQVEIEIYKDRGPFQANDTGQAITGRHIDVFVGPVTVDEANRLGTKHSKVRIL